MKRRPLSSDSLRTLSRNCSIAMGASDCDCNLIVLVPCFESSSSGCSYMTAFDFFGSVQACLELIDGKGGLFSCLDDIQRFEGKEANLKFLSTFKQKHGPPAGGGGGGGGGLRCACHFFAVFRALFGVTFSPVGRFRGRISPGHPERKLPW